jgi:hypothetical protein
MEGEIFTLGALKWRDTLLIMECRSSTGMALGIHPLVAMGCGYGERLFKQS